MKEKADFVTMPLSHIIKSDYYLDIALIWY